MDTFLGISITSLALGMIMLVSIVGVLLLTLAMRHIVLFKMGIRNMLRRRSQTVLIILGLMLSTVLITTSFTLGDTVGYSVKTMNLPQVGNLDEGLSKQPSSGRELLPYFSANEAQQVTSAIQADTHVAATVGAIITPQQSVAVYDNTTRQIVAENFILAVPPDFNRVWGSLQSTDGKSLNTAELSTGEVYMGRSLANHLGAHVGDTIRIFIEKQPYEYTIRAILNIDINPTNGSSTMVVMQLAQFQQLVHQSGGVNIFYIRNKGQGGLDNLGPNNSVSNAVAKDLSAQFPSYTVSRFKEDAVSNAAITGSVITIVIAAISLLLIVAGMLLIYLIFVMLAAERKAELGMSRAIGMKRRHLIEMFVFEGIVYTLGSTLVGIPLGIGITAILVQFINSVLLPTIPILEVRLQLQINWTSLLISFCLGLLLTLLVVTVSAYRVSRTNIVAAIRDLEDTSPSDVGLVQIAKAIFAPFRRGYRLLLQGHPLSFLSYVTLAPLAAVGRLLVAMCERGPLTLLLGLLLTYVGIRAQSMLPYSLGVSLLILGVGFSVRWFVRLVGGRKEVADRLGFSLLGAALLFYWVQPLGPVEKLIGVYDRLGLSKFQSSPASFFLAIIITVAGAIWLIMYNGDVLIKGVMLLTSRFGSVAPVTRTSMAYPLTFKFRTGLTVAMFSLVIFVTMLIVVLTSALDQNSQVDQLTGGWEIQTDSPGLPANLISEIQANPKLSQEIDTSRIVWQATQLSNVQQLVPGRKNPSPAGTQLVRAANDVFFTNNFAVFQSRATGYTTDRQVWNAVKDQEGLAVITSDTLVGIDPGFQPFDMLVSDAQAPGVVHRVKVIGVLNSVTYQWPGLYISTRTGTQIFTDSHLTPKWYLFHVRPGASEDQVRLDLGEVFGAKYGMEAESTTEKIQQGVVQQDSISSFLMGYLALGLIIGICGLGVISSRAVVERRQQIGMLRALGYSQRLVQLSFLLESSFIAILGLLIGTALGIWSAYQAANALIPGRNVFNDAFHMPFLTIGLILVGSYLATLLTTYLPARAAAKVLPAEALRYE